MSKLHTLLLKFGYWDDELEDFVPIVDRPDAELAAIKLGCSEELIVVLSITIGNIVQAVSEDLRNIHARLDRAGIPQ